MFMQNYRIPIVSCIFLSIGALLWCWQEHYSIQEYGLERLSRSSHALCSALEGSIRTQNVAGRFQREHLEAILESVVNTSKLRFIILSQNGKKLLEAGESQIFSMPIDFEGENLQQDIFLFSKRVRLQDYPLQKEASSAFSPKPDLEFGHDHQLLTLGLDTSKHWELYEKFVRRAFFATLVMLFCTGMILLVWILTIRNRYLQENLYMQKTRANYLEELGLVAAGIAHETKNPLGIIRGLAQRISNSSLSPQKNVFMAEEIIDAVDQTVGRLDAFMAYAKFREAKLESINAAEILDKVSSVLAPSFEFQGVALKVEYEDFLILVDPEMLRQLLVNILLNSLHACEAGKEVSVELKRNREFATLYICDQGKGISPELLPKIFKPYVSDFPQGHGLGLSIVKSIVDLHSWNIKIDSSPNQGTTVMISQIVYV